MDEHVHDDLVVAVRRVSEKVEGVEGTEKCFVLKAGMTYLVDLHVLVDANLTVKCGHDIAHRVQDSLLEEIPEIGNVLIHIEPKE